MKIFYHYIDNKNNENIALNKTLDIGNNNTNDKGGIIIIYLKQFFKKILTLLLLNLKNLYILLHINPL